MGAEVTASPNGTAPLRVRGHRALHGLTWHSPVASAQVKSAILLAALSAEAPSTVVEPLPTRDHTERMLRMCGVDVTSEGSAVTMRPGEVQPFGFRIPADISSAAFFLAAGGLASRVADALPRRWHGTPGEPASSRSSS